MYIACIANHYNTYHHATYELLMWLLAWEVSADYNTCFPRIVSLLMLTITYLRAIVLHIHTIRRVGSTTIQRIACRGSWPWNQCHDWWWKWKILSGNQTHIFCISGQCANHHTTMLLMPYCLCSLRSQCRILQYHPALFLSLNLATHWFWTQTCDYCCYLVLLP